MLFWHGTMRCAKIRARWSAIVRPAPARVCATRCAHMTRRIYKQGGGMTLTWALVYLGAGTAVYGFMRLLDWLEK